MNSSLPNEPQSIVHQIIRTSKKLTRRLQQSNTTRKAASPTVNSLWMTDRSPPVINIGIKNGVKKTRKLLDEAIKICTVECDTENFDSPSCHRPSIETAATFPQCADDDDSASGTDQGLSTTEGECEIFSAEKAILPLQTIDQNDFMIHCMIDTSRPCLIHFYVEDSTVSEILDKELGALHAQCVQDGAKCRFMRLNAVAAPYITSKLQVSSQDPSLICIHNGQVFERVADVESLVQGPGEVLKWATRTGLMRL
ncbi:hypothetical protein IV203_021846 [Nitzschia inconspicua]|uniref:Thioredoxin-like protein n=1 Tax=Nitzschia inconspicua TaxID=303405 RepID=A0A9K3KHH3_9STRA|nr:hypothetical protein IV203_033448 [Nitzschia inconspicua]KAG7343838.1 hypothetical protein IV203_021846 [Nitzschia inconspicua]